MLDKVSLPKVPLHLHLAHLNSPPSPPPPPPFRTPGLTPRVLRS